MLIRLSALQQWRVEGADGTVGSLVDVLFDDRRWVARYMVVETGRWLERERVLLAPALVHRAAGEVGVVHVTLTQAQVRDCPDSDSDPPVSRRYEEVLAKHYGYAPYWTGDLLRGGATVPTAAGLGSGFGEPPAPDLTQARADAAEFDSAEQSPLRSAREVLGYGVEARDGVAGDLDEMAIDDVDWAIRWLIVDTRRWWPGGRVMLAPEHVTEIRYRDARLQVDLDRETLRQQPPG